MTKDRLLRRSPEEIYEEYKQEFDEIPYGKRDLIVYFRRRQALQEQYLRTSGYVADLPRAAVSSDPKAD